MLLIQETIAKYQYSPPFPNNEKYNYYVGEIIGEIIE
jgi:hypothetical protein